MYVACMYNIMHIHTYYICTYVRMLYGPILLGTEFMARLDKQLKYFIHKKLSTDPMWRNVKVVFSGHEVHGLQWCWHIRL